MEGSMVYFELNDEQVKELAKKDKKLLIEIQKEIHLQKESYYEKLRRFYWVVSIGVLIASFVAIYFIKTNLLVFFVQNLAALLLVIAGGKLYYIDKPSITKKAFSKSKKKHLDAIEFEIKAPADELRHTHGIILISLGCLIYLLSFIIIMIS